MFPRFYPIVDSSALTHRLVGAGVKFIQLRIKNMPVDDVRSEVRAALLFCEKAGAELVLNDHWQIALDEGCTYVHLGQDDMQQADIAAIRRADVRIGLSTHTHEELDRALALSPDYVALGPIYPTTLKVMPFAPQGLARITEWKTRIGQLPLVAIGGITYERAHLCYNAGADCVAVVNDVVNHTAPEQRARQYLEMTP